jgi:radical SAM superfamily enzyme YgiQ (UPF0313 family)
MVPKILLVNPPIYDFAAYDFWLKPYGLLSVAGFFRHKADFKLFDYLDRSHPFMASKKDLQTDRWGRGRFYCEKIPSPDCLKHIPRYFRRFGLPQNIFTDFLKKAGHFDFVFIQTTMTYWYPAVQEVIQDIRCTLPRAKIVLGGNYVTLCPRHAKKLQADFLVKGSDMLPLSEYLNIKPDTLQPAFWQAYEKLNVGVLKLTEGCPFKSTYCSVLKVYGTFKARPLQRSFAEMDLMLNLNALNIAFYDDALLFKPEMVVVPFLKEVLKRNLKVNFHTPNALNARFITEDLARLLVQAGFKTFYLGFESASKKWQQSTGRKVSCDELAKAVDRLTAAGASHQEITAYQIIGHPKSDIQQLEATMRFANSLGIRGMLADFSPIPGTEDSKIAAEWVDMDEPLLHNKTAFPIILFGNKKVNELKDLQRHLNRKL